MKTIEALKEIKLLQRKADDLQTKVARYCADLDFETPTYLDQKQQVREWIQAHGDILKEILRLRLAIQRTNLATLVKIDIGGKVVEQSMAAWIHRRRDLAGQQEKLWASVGDRNLREGTINNSSGEQIQVHIRRYYDPVERDTKVELYRSEPMTVDSVLEVTNCLTDLIE